MEETNAWSEFWDRRNRGFIGNIVTAINYHVFYRKIVRKIIKYSYLGDTIEVGCGFAELGILLHKKRGDNIWVLDISEYALDVAKGMAAYKKVPIQAIKSDARNIPLSNKQMDTAFSNGLLEHFDEKSAIEILKEIRRISYRNFQIIPEKSINWKAFKFLKSLLRLDMGIDTLPFNAMTKKDAIRLFQQAGYIDILCKRFYLHGCPHLLIIGIF